MKIDRMTAGDAIRRLQSSLSGLQSVREAQRDLAHKVESATQEALAALDQVEGFAAIDPNSISVSGCYLIFGAEDYPEVARRLAVLRLAEKRREVEELEAEVASPVRRLHEA